MSLGRQDYVFCVTGKERVGQRRAKVGSIKSISRLGDVHLFTSSAVDLYSILSKLITECVGNNFCLIAVGAWAIAIGTLQIFPVDDCETWEANHEIAELIRIILLTFWRADVPGVDQTIHVGSVTVESQKLFVLELLFSRGVISKHQSFAFGEMGLR